MRVFVPALTDELSCEAPVTREGWTAVIPAGTHPEQAEVYEDDAVTEAALDGLSLLRDEESPAQVRRAPRRLVLAADLPASRVHSMSEEAADEDGVVFSVSVQDLAWSDIAAIMIDDADAEAAVGKVLAADTQDEADEAISELWEYAIGWFDIAERADLAAALQA